VSYSLDDLIYLMSRLRDPEQGCPWDLKQDFDTIIPHTIEEAYEVADAIITEDWPELRKELGDLVFQVAFYSQLASEKDWFDFHQVIDGLVAKMIRRHPHVFPSGQLRSSDLGVTEPLSDEVLHEQWNSIKQQETAEKKKANSDVSIDSRLDGVPEALTPLLKAYKLQKKAARVGFDWDKVSDVVTQLLSEVEEVQDATSQDHIEEEIGDLLFCCVNLARHKGVNPETALMKANNKFLNRFKRMEDLSLSDGTDFDELSLDQKDSLWQRVKQLEK
jgi:ATP diphosphatase